ncbi:MAG: aconitase/3-isopropylmalate dehydratase large subunit family protein [Chloroflexota bacterium]
MSGLTFAEKALARASGNESVRAGDVVDVRPDVMFSHDNTAYIRKIFLETGAKRILHPERVAITLDHAVPAPTTRHAQNHAEIRQWVREQNITHFFEVGRGICHQVLSEEAIVLSGEVIFGSDSHSTHFGWLGAFGMGVGRTEMASLWATGELWLRVPETMKITLTGHLQSGVTAKDIALYILRTWGSGGGQYRAIEFAGDAIATLSLDERAVLTNSMAEFGAMSAYMPPDEQVFDYLESNRTRDYTPLYPDADAIYSQEEVIDISALQAQIACPHSPDNVLDVTEVIGRKVHQAFIGTCTNGRYEDIAIVAQVVRGQQVQIPLLVIPASSQVLLQATRDGHIATLLEAGVTIGTPGCGPCMGNHMGVPAPNDVAITTMNRNFRGRMGTGDAEIYLANPYVVAMSALAGEIVAYDEAVMVGD